MGKRKKIIVGLAIIGIILVTLCLPREIIKWKFSEKIAKNIEDLPKSNVAIIFGTLIDKKGTISPLLRERLIAGIAIQKSTKSDKIVVSNTQKAAEVMKKYVTEQEVASNLIEVDSQANTTLDTCRYEKEKHMEKRKVIFVSQSFHLPRLLFQCQREGVEGIAFPAEVLTKDQPKENWITRSLIRAGRYWRESWLTWLALLRIYN